MASTKFNQDQQQAIMHTIGPAMVIAGPGSGKTTVITNRVKQLIDSGTAWPQEILVITFTATAAAEMKARYLKLCRKHIDDAELKNQAAHCSENSVCKPNAATSSWSTQREHTVAFEHEYSKVTFGTFHSVFYQYLRRIPGYAGLRLAEPAECINIIKAIVHAIYPDNSRFTSDYYTYILTRISYIKNTEQPNKQANAYTGFSHHKSEKYCTSAHPHDAAAADLPHRITEIYQQELLKRRLIDFDDMLVLFNKCLTEDARFRDLMRRRFRFILIDEFQDINRVQFDAVITLAAPLNNLFVVGDDDQSIYAFRGSDPSIMLKFKDYYPDSKYIELFTNYRSSKDIIRTASRLISHNKDRYSKQFETVKELRLPVAVRSFRTQTEEAQFVVRDIMRLPKELKTVGILYRTHRTGSAVKGSIAAALNNPQTQAKSQSQSNAVSTIKGHQISLMTFHACKGLEFDAVYIISANEDITPSKSSGKDGINEERRLFYVAMTRAKQFLHISDTRFIYNKSQCRSRFVREAIGARAAVGDIFRNITGG